MNRHRAPVGFSIIELLIAVIIIGILVAIIIPVLLRKAEDARIAAAESDLEHLQAALERAYINTGHIFRFYVLDDLEGGDGRYTPGDLSDLDGVRDEASNPTVIDPTRMFIDYKTGLFDANYITLYNRLSRNETDFGWGGPYINFSRMKDVDLNDIPEDPWGEEYLLFTPEGVVNQVNGTIETWYTFVARDTGANITIYRPFFDRFTILSKGPNGAPGDGTAFNARFGQGDDLFRQF
ncbi:MAG: prepilin-type N-terminal cleavage/methylation domain-containing protein [Candidatus Sumerlaeia bacterium]|nr:prepilin-type N-terminal cleavage/methylation domain-containing protein [Candidatus Sumerlaeia bacterium]